MASLEITTGCRLSLPDAEFEKSNICFPNSSIEPAAAGGCRHCPVINLRRIPQIRRNQPLQSMAAGFVFCPAAATGCRLSLPAAPNEKTTFPRLHARSPLCQRFLPRLAAGFRERSGEAPFSKRRPPQRFFIIQCRRGDSRRAAPPPRGRRNARPRAWAGTPNRAGCRIRSRSCSRRTSRPPCCAD